MGQEQPLWLPIAYEIDADQELGRCMTKAQVRAVNKLISHHSLLSPRYNARAGTAVLASAGHGTNAMYVLQLSYSRRDQESNCVNPK